MAKTKQADETQETLAEDDGAGADSESKNGEINEIVHELKILYNNYESDRGHLDL